MKPTVRLGRIFGIEVGVHWSVLVIAGLLAFGLTGGIADAELWIVAILAVACFLGSLLAHELAHSVVARRNGMQVTGITLWLLGGVAQLGGPMPSAGAELRIAAAGPATSIALGVGFFLVAIAGAASGVVSALVVSAIAWLALVNGVLAVFNLIPAAPLDGGRILAGALWARHGDRNRAEITATRAGKVVGFGLIAAGLVGTILAVPFVTIWTALLGWFIVSAASAEQRHAVLSRSLGDLRVRDAMSPKPETTRGWVTVQAFIDAANADPPRHDAFPVEQWEGGISGIVTLDAIRAVLPEARLTTRIVDVTIPLPSLTVSVPDERLVDLMSRPPNGRLPYVLVFAAGELVGIVTATDIQRVMAIASLRPPDVPPLPADQGDRTDDRS
ncbi:MAG TPA: site-2 protease family protein [Acidimicrobiia bacterium]|jgi:Zn-dependent protease